MSENPATYLITHGLQPFVDPYTQGLFLRRAKEGDLDAVRAYLALGMPIDVRDPNSQSTALIRATEGNHPDLIRLLTAAGADLEARDKDDDTALMTAVNWGNPEALRALIELGADLNTVSRRNGTPLVAAIENNRLKLAQMLLQAGANPDKSYGEGVYTALFNAVADDKAEFVSALIAAGANIDTRHGLHRRPLLVLAATKDHTNLIPLLIEAGADLAAADDLGWTAWRAATYLGHDDTVASLVAAGATTLATPEHALLHAAQSGDVDALHAALAAGADLAACDLDGDSALALAYYKGQTQAVQFLLERGAAALPVRGPYSPLSYAVMADSPPCVTLLLQAGVDPPPEERWPPLIKAAQKELVSIGRMLLTAGADVNTLDAYGQTALHWAAYRGNLNFVDLLLEAGIRLNIRDDDGRTALYVAVENRRIAVIEQLIAAGADLNVTNNTGETVLHKACMSGNVELALLLLRAGADPAQRNSVGSQPLTQARLMDKEDCVAAVVDFLTAEAYAATLAELGLREDDALPETFYERLATRQSEAALVEWVHLGRTDVVAGLLRAGCSPDVCDGYYKSLLSLASEARHVELVTLLLAAGADVETRSNTGSTALHWVASAGFVPVIQALVEAGADPNQGDNWRHTPVHYAAGKGRVGALIALQQAGGLIDPDPAGESPLMRAARFNQPHALCWLVEFGAALDTRSYDLDTSLSLAVQKRTVESVAFLLQAGADPNPVDKSGRTPLMQAAEAGEADITRLLLEWGADPSLVDAQGRTALDLAAYRPEIIALLSAAQGATQGIPASSPPLRPPDLSLQPPLHRAARRSDLTEVQRLLAQGAEVDARNARGDTALMIAAGRGHVDIVRSLLAAGADVQAENGVGETAWVLAVTLNENDETVAALRAAGARPDVDKMAEHLMRLQDLNKALQDGSLSRVRAMVQSGAVDIDRLSTHRESPLLVAVHHGDAAMARMLLAAGADPSLPNRSGFTPLMMAVRQERSGLVEMLLEAGAEVNWATAGGWTALMFAVEAENIEITTRLLDAGADPNQAGISSATPLMLATVTGSETLLTLLLAHGADLHARDQDGWSAVDWAILNEQPTLAAYLQQAGGSPPGNLE
jgi:ankyrin repeat protein